MARGGVYVGIARGAWLADHAIREQHPALQTIREAVDIVRLLLSGQRGGYQGRVYQLAPHVHAPYPLPDRPIPVLIGTWGKLLAALAGEIADEVKIGGSANPDMVPVMRRYIAAGAKPSGRSPEHVGIVVGAVSVVDHDRERARHAARRSVALYLPVVAGLDPTLTLEPDLIERLKQLANVGDWDAAARLISDDLLDRFAFSGNAQDLIDHGNRLFAAGASRIEFGTPHGLTPETGINILGQHVIPALRNSWPPR